MAGENLHEEHRARMKARVERDGLESLAEHEALEYLLFMSIPRQDTNVLAHRLIEHFGDFCKVMEAEPEELEQVPGIGPKSAHLISTVMAFSRYYTLKNTLCKESCEEKFSPPAAGWTGVFTGGLDALPPGGAKGGKRSCFTPLDGGSASSYHHTCNRFVTFWLGPTRITERSNL